MRLSRAHDPWVRAAWVDGKRLALPKPVWLSRFIAQNLMCAGHIIDEIVTALLVCVSIAAVFAMGWSSCWPTQEALTLVVIGRPTTPVSCRRRTDLK